MRIVFLATGPTGVLSGSVSAVSWTDVRWTDWLHISAAYISQFAA